MRKKLLFSVLLLLTFSFSAAIAQEITVSGTVTSAEDGEPIPGASVAVRGTTIGTVTDIDGFYSINVPAEESVLRFSFVGMLSREIMVGDQRTIDVELEPDIVGLDEVVVTGYGVQRRRDLTGSVSSVRSRDIESMPVTGIDRAIQGRAAGVQVTGGSGVPGGHVSVIVRGIGSFSSNTPLYIVDGVEIRTAGLSGTSASHNVLANLDFNDIETIDILKDAAASAIYGARGAAGVVIITTKRGQAAEKTEFNVEISRGYTEGISKLEMLDSEQWVGLYLEQFVNRLGMGHSFTQARYQEAMDRGWVEFPMVGDQYDFTQPDFSNTPYHDWVDAVNRTGTVLDARLNARGGTESTRFYSSLSHNSTQGHILGYDFARSSFRLNLDHDATDRLSFDVQVSANLSDQNTTRAGGAFTNPILSAYFVPPINAIYDEEGNFVNHPRSLFGMVPSHSIYSIEKDHNITRNLKTILNFSATYDFTDHLSYRAAFGLDYNHTDDELWYDPRASDGVAANGLLYDYEYTNYSYQTTQTLNYNNVFGDVHNVSGVAGFETWDYLYRVTQVIGENFPNPNMNVMSAAAQAVGWGGNETERSRVGAFGRINYSYDDRYMLTLTGRYDGSSRFGADNRYGFFPAAAVGWRVSSEPFMAGIDRIDNLMLRLSYGVSGTDAAGTYAALGLWSGGTQYLGNVGIFPTQLPNRFLTWEESRTLNLAITTSAFRGRVNLDMDIYRRYSEELLLGRPLPASTGWTSITENVGRTVNEGVEISLNTVNIQTDNFTWSTNFNISFVENEILELLPGQDFFSTRRAVGRAINDWYIPIWAGVNPADGRPMYYDRNQDITYNPVYADRQWMGPIQPTRYGGITNEFRFGNFSASIFFQYSGGSYRYADHNRYVQMHNTANLNQLATTWTERWREPGDITGIVQPNYFSAYAGDVMSPTSHSSRLLERVDYIRLKDAHISYTVPRTITQRFGVDNLRVFVRGANLVTWHDYSGWDPEFTGSDFFTYPQGRSITIGVNTTF